MKAIFLYRIRKIMIKNRLRNNSNTQNKDCISIKITPISKTLIIENNQIVPGIDVISHCLIAGYVAGAILDCFPQQLRKCIFPSSSEFIAACHDIGKISPAFQKMIYKNISNFNERDYPELEGFESCWAKRSNDCFHAKVTQVFFRDLLKTVSIDNDFISIIEGMHHGFRPTSTQISEKAEKFGGDKWSNLRHEVLKKLCLTFFQNKDLDKNLEPISSWNKASSIGGLIIVADWIASGGIFENFTQDYFNKLSESELKECARKAVDQAGFSRIKVKSGLSFFSVFGFEPRKIQSDFFESVNGPGVYILEAPMGIGKTEAALYAAYKILGKGQANGIYFGLPTQLTSNKVFERMLSFLEKITGDNSEFVKLKLLHGTAWLEEKVFGEDGGVGKNWFDFGKRGILAPFAVGTVDQALMAVLNVRHEMVRSFGLAGKVVILDEVHSYDTYTGTILNRLIKFLIESQCTVIVLSATLTVSQKKMISGVSQDVKLSLKYPLITAIPEKKRTIEEIISEGNTIRDVNIIIKHDDNESLENAVQKAIAGQQVLWIENTIASAQQVFKKIIAKTSGANVECGLIHSRFLKTKRTENESRWTELFGRDCTQRTIKGRILVGTQVLEQSIDIDADFLVTRICPTDMLFQRLGRLWRHTKNDLKRPNCAICSAEILSPEYEKTLKLSHSFGDSAYVYSEYVLCRTLEVWKDLKNIRLPEDIRWLLEETYKLREDEGRLKKLKDELEAQKVKLESFARIGLSRETATMDEMNVQTRYSEIECVNVLLLKSFNIIENGCEICFYDNNDVMKVFQRPRNINEKRKIAKAIMEHCVTVSEKDAPKVDKLVMYFSSYVYTGMCEDDDEKSSFRVAIVGSDDYLRTLANSLEILEGNKKILYTSKLGYQIMKEE